MVKIHLLFLFSLFGAVLASEVTARDDDCDDADCITNSLAKDIVSRWTSIAIKIDVGVVNRTVTDNIVFFSDNQNFLEGTPVGSVTGKPSINGKQDLINQQEAAQAPGTTVIPQSFTIFQIIHNCNTITFRWRFHAISSGTDPHSTNKPGDPVEYAGIDILIVDKCTKLITTAYSEWNSGELLYDLGTRFCIQKGNASACA